MAEREDITPLTIHRRDYILRMLARRLQGGNWIRISNNELLDFGGEAFFKGCRVEYVNDSSWFTKRVKSGWDQDENVSVHLPWKITTPSGGGWTPENTHHEGKTEMQEHHIDRERLIAQVNANKGAYELVYAKFQALYADELQAQSDRHLAGEIPANQIAVRDKDGSTMSMLTDMSLTFDQQVKELELDSREVVILNHEEYGQYVDGNATNLLQVAAAVKKLEELP